MLLRLCDSTVIFALCLFDNAVKLAVLCLDNTFRRKKKEWEKRKGKGEEVEIGAYSYQNFYVISETI